MTCPLCKEKLDKAIFYSVEVDYCPVCLGMFFEEDELKQAKDEKDDELRWLDIDPWKKEEDFKLKRAQKLCPKCRFSLYEVDYGGFETDPAFDKLRAGVKVDICYYCRGIWLDRGEFKKIMDYLKERADYEVLRNWAKNLKQEFWEIFTGPETFKDELLDFLMLLKILNYKFAVQHPLILSMIANLPK